MSDYILIFRDKDRREVAREQHTGCREDMRTIMRATFRRDKGIGEIALQHAGHDRPFVRYLREDLRKDQCNGI